MSEEQHHPPEVRLFRSIIATAVYDAIHGTYIRNENEKTKADAMRWFLEAGADFHMVCECAGLHPQRVRTAALQFIDKARQNPRDFRRTAA